MSMDGLKDEQKILCFSVASEQSSYIRSHLGSEVWLLFINRKKSLFDKETIAVYVNVILFPYTE